MEKRVTEVRAHLRGGKAVAAHPRILAAPARPGKTSPPHPGGLHAMSGGGGVEEASAWVNGTAWRKAGRVSVRRFLDPDGRPVTVTVEAPDGKASLSAGLPVATEPTVSDDLLLHSVNYSRMRLDGYRFFSRQAENLNFGDAQLDGAVFQNRRATRSGFFRTGIFLNLCTFDGASLRGADLRDATLRGCTFVGADLTGADLAGATVMGGSADFTDSNITAEQFDSLAGEPVYRRYSLAEAAGALGVADGDVAVMIWAGDLEVRDVDGRVVTGEFDTDRHHIPQWAVQAATR